MTRDRRSYSVVSRRGATSNGSRDLRDTRHRNGIQKRRQSNNDERVFDDTRTLYRSKFKFRPNFNNKFRNNGKYNNNNNNRRIFDRNTLRNTMRNKLVHERNNRIASFRRTTLHNNKGIQRMTKYQSKFDRSRQANNNMRYRKFGDRSRIQNNNFIRKSPSRGNFRNKNPRFTRRVSTSSYDEDSDNSAYGNSSRMTPSSYEEETPPPPSPPPLPRGRPQTPPLPKPPPESPFQPNQLPMKTLVITGIKDSRDPRTEPLINLLIKIGEKLNVTLHRTDIDSISRLNDDKDKIKVIFVHSSIKKLLMKNIRLKKCLSTKEINLHYDNQIYLNDELSIFGEFVFRKARYLKARRLIENTWTVDGKVLYKVRPGDSPRRCQTLEELLDLEISQKSSIFNNNNQQFNKNNNYNNV